MLTIEEALQTILDYITQLETEKVSKPEASYRAGDEVDMLLLDRGLEMGAL